MVLGERGWGGGGRIFEAERLLTSSAFGMGAYSKWALIQINTVISITLYQNSLNKT